MVILKSKDGRDGKGLITEHVNGVHTLLKGSEVAMELIDVLAKLV